MVYGLLFRACAAISVKYLIQVKRYPYIHHHWLQWPLESRNGDFPMESIPHPELPVGVKFHTQNNTRGIKKKYFNFWQILRNFEWFYKKQYLTRVHTLHAKRDKIFVCYWNHSHSSRLDQILYTQISQKSSSLLESNVVLEDAFSRALNIIYPQWGIQLMRKRMLLNSYSITLKNSVDIVTVAVSIIHSK